MEEFEYIHSDVEYEAARRVSNSQFVCSQRVSCDSEGSPNFHGLKLRVTEN